MIPKTIHLCWFSGEPYPVEVLRCLDSWQKVMPDYTVRLWDYEEAQSLGSRFVNEALACKKWAFAADAVRFYAVWKEGGIYMDSDILLYKRFDDILPAHGCATFNEYVDPNENRLRLQAACFIGEKGNAFCRQMWQLYQHRPFILPNGEPDLTISPYLMAQTALKYGLCRTEKVQHLGELTVWPTWMLTPSKSYPAHKDAIGMHCILGSWRKRSWGRRLEIRLKHTWNYITYQIRPILKLRYCAPISSLVGRTKTPK